MRAGLGAVGRKPRVLMIASEASPFAKTGGLADVLGALPPALGRLGWDVTLALPRYRGVPPGRVVATLPVTVGGVVCPVVFHEAPMADGVRALLIDCPELFDRDGLYQVDNVDFPDNPRRFGLLARAALEFAARQDARPDVIHAHDWQAGLAPVYLDTMYAAHPVLRNMPRVFTIHNLAYQGLFEPDWLPRLDLPWELLAMEQLEYWGRISFLKGGINHADAITTVSRTYAAEIQTPELGFGFDGILRRRAADLFGILNGIDTKEWDPAHDPLLPSTYDAAHLDGKRAAKLALLKQSGLATDAATRARPVIGMISRMVDQKGLDLIAAVADRLATLDATFVVLGSGDERYEQMWTTLAATHPDRIAARIGFDEALAHLIEAGADMFLMPSQFEPCGLNQMYSLRYGTVPIVRAVGGLADTVVDAASIPPQRPAGERSRVAGAGPGIVFHDYTPEALLLAIERALGLFRNGPAWRALQLAGMAVDHSWDRSAQEYVKIYERAVAHRARG